MLPHESAENSSANPHSRPWVRWCLQAALAISFLADARAADPTLLEQARQVFQPLPESMATAEYPTPPERVALGRRLFFDKRLSLDGTVSCETCHLPGLHGMDGQPKSIGVQRRPNARNAPTVLNAALQFKAHWDGGRDGVEDQATQALIGPASFGNSDYPAVIAKLKALGYETGFSQAFPGEPDPIKPENWGKAIGSYERTLVTPAPFDDYLKGNPSALSPEAQRGLKTFMTVGCSNCHGGVALGGTTFQKFGLFGDYWKATGQAAGDEGRYGVTKDPADRYRFKVPGLRNVAMTPPYFHDGSVDDLGQAVRLMGKLQLGQDLSPAQIQDVVAFLRSLTGSVPKQFAAEPPGVP
jgi:cytochrome c peroxidase